MPWGLNHTAKPLGSVLMMFNQCLQQVAFLFSRHVSQPGLFVVDHRRLVFQCSGGFSHVKSLP